MRERLHRRPSDGRQAGRTAALAAGPELGDGQHLAGPPRGLGHGAVPAERDVHVVFVVCGPRAAAGHLSPTELLVVDRPDALIPDDVHDAQPVGDLAVVGGHPLDHVGHLGAVFGLAGVHVPVERPALFVLGRAAAGTEPRDAPRRAAPGLDQRLEQRCGAGLGRWGAGLLRDVAEVRVDAGGLQRLRRRRVGGAGLRDGCQQHQ